MSANFHLWRGQSNAEKNLHLFSSYTESFGFSDVFLYKLNLLFIIQFKKFTVHTW